MKTKLLFGMFAATGIMLATSCSNDEQVLQEGNEAQVTFSLGVENNMNTRAISEGTGINQLFYAIFDSEGKMVSSSKNQEINNFPHDTSIKLLKGETYTAVFWAQNKACKAYSISDDMKSITVNYENSSDNEEDDKNPLNNDETKDAFFKAETFEVTDSKIINVVLKRPFAQLNVGMTKEEWESAEKQGVTIQQSKVEIKQVATTLNLIDGTVGNPKDITFEANAIPTETLKIDRDCDGKNEEYKYLSMSYFLANDATDGASKTTLSNLKITLYTSSENAKTIVMEEGLANAPVQRNHRTNIISLGKTDGILTSDVEVKVLLDPLYDGEHTYTDENIWENYEGIYTEEALAGLNIEIPKGWHIRNGYILEPMPEYWTEESAPLYTQSYTIDGKGNTVTFEPYEYKFVTKNAFAATDGKEVSIKNIIFAGEHSGIFGGVYGGVKGRNDYKTVFEGVKIVGNGIYCYNKDGSNPISAFSNLGTSTLEECVIKETYWVGAEKDENTNATKAKDNYGVHDVFVPNSATTLIKSSEIGSIFVAEHGNLTISGNETKKSVVNQIISKKLVKGQITIENYAEVTLLDVNQHSDSYPPVVKINSGAKIETLQLNSINKSNVELEDGASITKIIYKGVEYTFDSFKAL